MCQTPTTLHKSSVAYSFPFVFSVVVVLHQSLAETPSATKNLHHVVRGNRAGQLHDVRGVEVFAQGVEGLVGHFDIERHLLGVLNHQLFDWAQSRVCAAEPTAAESVLNGIKAD